MATALGFLQQTFKDLTTPAMRKQWLWVGGFTILMAVNLLININWLKEEYPNPVQPPDLFLDLIPETEEFITVGEIFSAIEVIVVIGILSTMRFKGAPKLIFLVMTMFWIRGYAILLTPLAQIQPPSENYSDAHFIAQNFYYGMFFSGHTASAFIQAFYFKGHRLRPLLFFLASVQAFSLIASHSHYSIDIFGGLFVAYLVTHFDFMRLVPPFLRNVTWMPWYAETPDTIQAVGVTIPELEDADRHIPDEKQEEAEEDDMLIKA